MGYTRIENLGGRGRSQRGAFGRVILVGAVPGPMGHYLRTSVSRCSPRRSHPGHWGPGSRLGPWDGARGSPEGRGRQLAAGGVLGGGDGGGFRGWAVVGESGRGDARVEVWVSAAAFGGGGGEGGEPLASWRRGCRSRQLAAGQRGQGRQSIRGGRHVISA